MFLFFFWSLLTSSAVLSVDPSSITSISYGIPIFFMTGISSLSMRLIFSSSLHAGIATVNKSIKPLIVLKNREAFAQIDNVFIQFFFYITVIRMFNSFRNKFGYKPHFTFFHSSCSECRCAKPNAARIMRLPGVVWNSVLVYSYSYVFECFFCLFTGYVFILKVDKH